MAVKTHVALLVTDLERSIAFYQAMFGVEPVKHKVDYAKFDLENPGLNLTLNVGKVEPGRGPLSHLGIQVDSTEAVKDAIAKFQAADLQIMEEFQTDCCYALQDKVWITDPDGNRWEIFTVHVGDTAPELTVDSKFHPSAASGVQSPATSTCCS